MPTVLVIDDDAVSCRFMRLSLERDGFDVVEAHTGRDALTALARTDHPVDVLVTDYRMPEMSGLDIVAVATRMDAHLPCLMVTASTELDVATRAMANGAVGYLVKPFTGEALCVSVMRALERRHYAEEAMALRLVVPMLEQFTVMLANVVEARDVETSAHCQRLITVSDRVAEELGVSASDRKNIRLGACLHDIGKIAVPDAILHKPEALTPDEWTIVRRHPEVGAALLEDIDHWREARIIVRHHHERFDGTGYPDGLRRTRIPLAARIVALADAVDVMTFGRPYQPPRAMEEVLAEVQALRGQQFDPDVVDAFVALAGTDDALTLAMQSRELIGVGMGMATLMV